MADPRDNIKFDDIKAVFETYIIDDSSITYDATEDRGCASTMRDMAVSLSAAGTVQLAGDAEPVVGKLIEVYADDKCLVQVGGNLTLPGGSGATLTLGYAIVGDLGAGSAEGYIRISDGATAAEIAGQRGQILDAGTTTAVVVKFP